jgi:hypothetical protein
MVDFVRELSERTEITQEKIVGWVGISRGKFFDWRRRYGKVNEHNRLIPRDHWLEAEEEQRNVAFHDQHPLEGYRRLTYMMIDRDVAASPSTVYRVLQRAGRLSRWNRKPSKKGTGFVQPLAPHEHWHIDISYLNIASTYFYLCSVLDGASRAILHWDLRECMKESDVELILEGTRERYPGVKPPRLERAGRVEPRLTRPPNPDPRPHRDRVHGPRRPQGDLGRHPPSTRAVRRVRPQDSPEPPVHRPHDSIALAASEAHAPARPQIERAIGFFRRWVVMRQ